MIEELHSNPSSVEDNKEVLTEAQNQQNEDNSIALSTNQRSDLTSNESGIKPMATTESQDEAMANANSSREKPGAVGSDKNPTGGPFSNIPAVDKDSEPRLPSASVYSIKRNASVATQLEEVGDEHKYQVKIFIIFSIQWILAAFVIMGQPYLFMVPKFECQDPRDPSRSVECSELEQGCQRKVLKPNSANSIVLEYQLYCENSYLVYVAGCIFFTMTAAFSLFFAQFAEFKGRKRALLFSYILGAVSMFLATLMDDYWAVVILYSLAGSGFWSYTTITVVLLGETSSLKYVQYTTVGLLIIWATSEALLPALSFLVRSWRIFSLVFIVLPSVINFGFFYYIYESPRFLTLKNDFGNVKQILKKIAQVNGRLFTEEQEEESSIPTPKAKSTSRTYTYIDLVRYSSVRKMTLGAGILFFVSNFCYYGTMFALPNLHGSLYWNGFFLAVAEYLAYLVAMPILKKFSRKMVILITLTLTVLGSIGLIFFSTPQADWYCQLYGINCIDVTMEKVFSMFIKFQVAVCNTVLYVYSNELFPTAVKSLGLGWVNCTTMLGSLMASANEAICNWIGVHPLTSFIILCALSVLATFSMPETKDKPMEDEIEELKTKGPVELDMPGI